LIVLNFSKTVVLALVVMLLSEGMYLPLLYANGVPESLVKLLLGMKYVLVCLGVFAFLLKLAFLKTRLNRSDLFALTLLAILLPTTVIAILVQPSLDVSRFMLFIAPLALYLTGRSLSLTVEQLEMLAKSLVTVFLFISIYAVLDILFSTGTFWRDTVQQGRYMLDIKDFHGGLFNGVVANFYYDPWGLHIRRAIGTLGDPLAFAYSSVLPICLLWSRRRVPLESTKKKIAEYLIMGMALLFSLTRAVIVSLSLVLMLKRLLPKKFTLVSVIIAVVLLFVLANSSFITAEILGLNDSSTQGHLESLTNAGEMAKSSLPRFLVGDLVYRGSAPEQLFESGLLNLATTIGALALIYYYFVIRLIRRLFRSGSPTCVGIALCGVVGLVTSITFSESFFSFTGYGLFWIFAGIAITHCGREFDPHLQRLQAQLA
jgi:hypothetical protein